MANWEPKQLSAWHIRVIDLLIADPTLTAEQISFQLNGGIGPEMITVLRRTDMFKLALRERMENISSAIDGSVTERIDRKLHKLAEKAIDAVSEQLEREQLTRPVGVTNGAFETCEMVLSKLGYGKGPGGGAPIVGQQMNVVVNVTADDIAAAQAKMRAAHARPITEEPTRALPPPSAARAG